MESKLCKKKMENALGSKKTDHIIKTPKSCVQLCVQLDKRLKKWMQSLKIFLVPLERKCSKMKICVNLSVSSKDCKINI